MRVCEAVINGRICNAPGIGCVVSCATVDGAFAGSAKTACAAHVEAVKDARATRFVFVARNFERPVTNGPGRKAFVDNLMLDK